ncbi:dye decolorizing peroxidase [Microbacterium proteolyticum]|uniref:Dye decolorizing peroxidase n=1 Tax=Microbacterium proteolyticum TaxID=1572644 RepID=A0A7W5CKY5_9MICO|nr:Dyp-type peroxidase [Microbacterium proteolyticum]MBB3159090.1 dye decolorizing peroxidase [Microbacterium proteolyticum]
MRGSPRSAGGATRRTFLLGGAVAGVGAAAAVGLDAAVSASAQQQPSVPLNGEVTVPFHGEHQAGIDTDAQAHVALVALDLATDVDRAGLQRLMRTLTDDAARLTQGRSALADTEPELATAPARLTVTFGFGPGLVARAAAPAPSWLAPLPAFSIDRLRPEYGDGDLLLQVAADDAVTVAHATRMLLKDARAFATTRWVQHGFRRAHGTERPGTTMRNLFGQVDGTSNPVPGTPAFDDVVWVREGWLAGGTGMVVRRIAMDLDKWDRLDRPGRDQAVGRFQSTGAPLTGTDEFDEPDFGAKDAVGFPVIAEFSHLRRSRPDDTTQRIFRRGYNYDQTPPAGVVSDAGLLFVSFQADIERQFVPIQRRLDELDLLNEWTTPIGSAVFAVPPGCREGGYIGEGILS